MNTWIQTPRHHLINLCRVPPMGNSTMARLKTLNPSHFVCVCAPERRWLALHNTRPKHMHQPAVCNNINCYEGIQSLVIYLLLKQEHCLLLYSSIKLNACFKTKNQLNNQFVKGCMNLKFCLITIMSVHIVFFYILQQ